MQQKCDSFITSLTFTWYNTESADRIAVVNIDQEQTFDPVTGDGIENSMYDSRLGPYRENNVCSHCNLLHGECHGHFGKITFPKPVFNPLLFDQLMALLPCFCFHCSRMPSSPAVNTLVFILAERYYGTDRALTLFPETLGRDASVMQEFQGVSTRELRRAYWHRAADLMNRGKNCTHCNQPRMLYKHLHFCRILGHVTTKNKTRKKLNMEDDEDSIKLSDNEGENKFMPNLSGVNANENLSLYKEDTTLSPELLREKLVQLFDKEMARVLGSLPCVVQAAKSKFATPTDVFFLDFMLVPSPTYHPPAMSQGHLSMMLSSPTANNYRQVLLESNVVRTLINTQEQFLNTSNMDSKVGETMDENTPNPTTSSALNNVYNMVASPPPSARNSTQQSFVFPSPLFSLADGATPSPMQALTRKSATGTTAGVRAKLTAERHLVMLNQKMEDLQRAVNCCYDEKRARDYRHQNTQPGLRQRLDKKEGIVRRHIMGKRVNHACRSVISPDPLIGVHEVGVPVGFARRMTFPEIVSPYNIEEMRTLVKNGPSAYPGAMYVEMANGSMVRIPEGRNFERNALAATLRFTDEGRCMKVHRHLKTGDYLLLNRQPTLHRPSMQAHQVRVIDTTAKTLRLHYGICKAYNADFDGDEMNGHFVQTLQGKVELANIAAVPHMFLTPKSGTPLAGLIQDHVIAGTRLTMRDRTIDKETFWRLLNCGLGDILPLGTVLYIPPPAYLHPKRLWTGKQLMTALIMNLKPAGMAPLNVESVGKSTRTELWREATTAKTEALIFSDADLIVRGGEVLKGVFDSTYIGSTPQSLVHCFGEVYGPTAAQHMLNALSRMLTAFLSDVGGFTLGLEDLILGPRLHHNRQLVCEEIRRVGVEAFNSVFPAVAKEASPVGVPVEEVHTVRGQKLLALVANTYRAGHSAAEGADIKRSLATYQEKLIKAANVKMDEIQQAIPKSLYKGFPQNNLHFMISSGAKGNMTNQYQMSLFLGQITIEGRPIPMSVDGRTLPSFRPFDLRPRARGMCTDRFLTGLRPQELYFHSMAGRDGLVDTAVKTSSSGYLQRCIIKHLEDLNVKFDTTVRDSANEIVQFKYGDDGQDVIKSSFLSSTAGLSFIFRNRPIFQPMFDRVEAKFLEATEENDARTTVAKNFFNSQKKVSYDHPGCFPLTLKSVTSVVSQLQLRAQVDPGEMVGLLTAQSLGEPCTQMTMNTFHHAGRVEMNVTLGIPRLREILLSASDTIRTPYMTVPVLNTPVAKKRVTQVLMRWYNPLMLKEVLAGIKYEYNVETMEHVLTFDFVPHKAYKPTSIIRPDQIVKYMESVFFANLAKSITKHSRMTKGGILKGKAEATATGNVGGEEDAGGEEGAAVAAPGVNMDDENAIKAARRQRMNEDDGAEARKLMDEEEDEAGGEDIGDHLSEDMSAAMDEDEEDQKKINPKEMDEDEGDEAAGDDGEVLPEDAVGEPNFAGARRRSAKKEASTVKVEEEDPVDMARVHTVLKYHDCFTRYTYHPKSRSCTLAINFQRLGLNEMDLNALLQHEVEHGVVHRVPGIRKVLLDKFNEPWVLKIEGLNFHVLMQEAATLNLNEMYTNSISQMSRRYGIECARLCIIKEMQTIFGHYGLSINFRHFSLLSSYMTHRGVYAGVNRSTMYSHTSPFSRMSFETATSMLQDAILMGETEKFTSISSALVVGMLPQRFGSQLPDLLLNGDME